MSEAKLEWLKEKHKVKSEPAKRKSSAKEKSSKIIVRPEDYFPPQTVQEKQMQTLEKIEEQTERNTEFKELQEQREEELHTQVTELSKQGSEEYTEYMALMKEKATSELRTAKNYEEMSKIVLAQAKKEFADFKRRQKKNIQRMKDNGVNTIFDETRAKLIREGAKKRAK